MRMAQAMDADPLHPGGPECGLQHARAERVGDEVQVSIGRAPRARPVLAAAAPLGPIQRDGVMAVLAPAPFQPVGSRRAMPVPSSRGVRLGQAESFRIGEDDRPTASRELPRRANNNSSDARP